MQIYFSQIHITIIHCTYFPYNFIFFNFDLNKNNRTKYEILTSFATYGVWTIHGKEL